MTEWHDLYVTTASASAVLTGLIFVGISINLKKVLSLPTLSQRASISLILLFTILILSVLFLVPGQSKLTLGIESLLAGIFLWLLITKIDSSIYRNREFKFKKLYISNIAADQLCIIPYIVGGILIIKESDTGFYWLVVSLIFSFCKAGLDAWVLLIEINR